MYLHNRHLTIWWWLLYRGSANNQGSCRTLFRSYLDSCCSWALLCLSLVFFFLIWGWTHLENGCHGVGKPCIDRGRLVRQVSQTRASSYWRPVLIFFFLWYLTGPGYDSGPSIATLRRCTIYSQPSFARPALCLDARSLGQLTIHHGSVSWWYGVQASWIRLLA